MAVSFDFEAEGIVRNTKPHAKRVKIINTADFDAEYEKFKAMQLKLKEERLAKEAAEKAKAEETKAVAEEAYQAFVAHDETPKTSKKKKKDKEALVESINAAAETAKEEDLIPVENA